IECQRDRAGLGGSDWSALGAAGRLSLRVGLEVSGEEGPIERGVARGDEPCGAARDIVEIRGVEDVVARDLDRVAASALGGVPPPTRLRRLGIARYAPRHRHRAAV